MSIALRGEHYRMLQESRRGRLGPEYAAKLGWLTGNLYSRIATPDWEDQENDKTAASSQAQLLLRRVSQPEDENWVPTRWLRAAREKNLNLTDIPVAQFRSTLAEHAPPELIDVVLESVARVGRRVFAEKVYDSVRHALAGHTLFGREVAQGITGIAGQIVPAGKHAALSEGLASDEAFRIAVGYQVAGLLRTRATAIGEQAMLGVANMLAETTGVIAPAATRLRTILSALPQGMQPNDVEAVLALVASACVFNLAASEAVSEVAHQAFAGVDFGMLDRVVSRLKNDQKLRAACREQPTDPFLPSALSEE
ncbi:MAG: hypothetical protein ACYC35_04275 [Pirellulales bacterium]